MLARRAAIALAAALALPGAGAAWSQSPDATSLELRTIDGRKVSLRDLRGSVVVLNFWATWCKPCIEEIPVLAKIAERYGSRGLRVIAANVDEDERAAGLAQFAERLPEGMEVWVGATAADMQRMNAQALPTTVVLDRHGNRAQIHHGALGEGQLDELLKELLEDDSPKRKHEKRRALDVTEARASSPTCGPSISPS